jgi:hypothetical protein
MLLQLLVRIEEAFLALKRSARDPDPTRVQNALAALAETLPQELRAQKGTRLGDSFHELSAAIEQLLRAEDKQAPWYAVLREAANEATSDFEQALGDEQRKASPPLLA